MTSRHMRMSYVLCAFSICYWICRETMRSAISITLAESEVTDGMAGVLLSMQSLIPIFLVVPSTMIGDKFGHDKVMWTGTFIMFLSALCFFLSGGAKGEYYIILSCAAQIMSGVAQMLIWVSLQALVSDNAELAGGDSMMTRAVNRLMLICYVSSMIAPTVTGFVIDWFSADFIWIMCIALSLGQVAVCLYMNSYWKTISRPKKPEPAVQKDNTPKRSFPALLSEMGGFVYILVLLTSFVMMFAAEIKSSYLSTYLRSDGISAGSVGIIVASGVAVSCIARFVLNRRSVKLSDRTLFIVFSVTLSLGMLSLAVFPAGWLNTISASLLSLSTVVIEPLLLILIVRFTAPYRKGVALAGRVLANRVGMFLAPITAGFLTQLVGARMGFLILFIALSAICVIVNILFVRTSAAEQKKDGRNEIQTTKM